MKNGNFKTLPMKNLVLGISSEKRMNQQKVLTVAKLPSLLQKCCQTGVALACSKKETKEI